MTAPTLFTAPREFRPRRRRPSPVPPGLPLLILQKPRSLVLDGDQLPDLFAAAGVTRCQRALDGSLRWLAPRRDLMRLLRAAARQKRTVTVCDVTS
jgi:hypothetical protein